jgi:SSS family solute:Na+ symporter
LNTSLSWIDITIVFLFFCFIFGFGTYLRKWIKKPEDFFVAGRHLPPFILAATLAATNINLYNFLGYSGYSYREGISIIWHEWTGMMALAFAGIFIFPIFRRIKLVTVPEFLGRRFNRKLRVIVGFFWVIRGTIALGAIIYLVSQITCVVMGVEDTGTIYTIIIVIYALIAIAYTVAGGMWAVALTNVVQFILLLGGALIMIPIIMHAVGYWSGMEKILTSMGRQNLLSFVPTEGIWNWKGIIGIWLIGIQWASTDQTMLQVSLSSNTVRNGVKALVYAGLIMIPFSFIIPLPGIAAGIQVSRGILPAFIEQDNVVPTYLVSGIVPAGVLGLILCGLFASQFSTLNAHLSASTTLATLDVINTVKKKKLNNRQKLISLRVVLILIGISMIFTSFLAKTAQSAVDVMITLFAILDLPLFVLILFGIFWKRATPISGVTGYVVSICAGFILKFNTFLGPAFTNIAKTIYKGYSYIPIFGEGVTIDNANSWDIAIIGMIIAAAIIPLITLITKPVTSKEIEEIFQRNDTSEKETDRHEAFKVWPKDPKGRLSIMVILCGLVIFLSGLIMGRYPAKTGYTIPVVEVQRFEQAAFLLTAEDLREEITVESRRNLLDDLTVLLKMTDKTDEERQPFADELVVRMKELMRQYLVLVDANPQKFTHEYRDEFQERLTTIQANPDGVIKENRFAGIFAIIGMLIYFLGALIRLKYD